MSCVCSESVCVCVCVCLTISAGPPPCGNWSASREDTREQRQKGSEGEEEGGAQAWQVWNQFPPTRWTESDRRPEEADGSDRLDPYPSRNQAKPGAAGVSFWAGSRPGSRPDPGRDPAHLHLSSTQLLLAPPLPESKHACVQDEQGNGSVVVITHSGGQKVAGQQGPLLGS